jgi:WD40 repeat protein
MPKDLQCGTTRDGADTWPIETTAVRPTCLQFTTRWLLLIVAITALGIYGLSPVVRPRPPSLPSPYGCLHAMALTSDEKWLVTGGLEDVASHHTAGVVSLLDLATGQARWVYKFGNTDKRFESFRISTDGRTLIGQTAHSLRFLNMSNGRLLRLVPGLSDRTGCQTMSPDASLAAWATEAGIRLQDVASGKPLSTLAAPPSSVLEFSRDSKLLASARGWLGQRSQPDDVTLWDVASAKPAATLNGQLGGISCLAFAPDGKTLAAGWREDGAILLWDVASGRLIASLQPHARSTKAMAFSPDSKTLASVASGSSTSDDITFWDVSTFKDRGHTSTGKQDMTCCLLFDRTGTTLFAGCEDGTILIRESKKLTPPDLGF